MLVIRILRILNAIRTYSTGVPLTFKQFSVFYRQKNPFDGLQWLLLRLTKRRQAGLAFFICDYLATAEESMSGIKMDMSLSQTPSNLTPLHETVLRTWAVYKLNQTTESEESIAQALLEKLENSNLLPEVARLANSPEGHMRQRVAKRLIEHEKRPAHQVPLLLEIGEYEQALEKAVKSHDPDLLSEVIDRLRNMTNSQLLMLLHRHKTAMKFYQQQMFEKGDIDSYFRIAEQESDFLGQAIFHLRATVLAPSGRDCRDDLRRSHEAFRKQRGYEWVAESIASQRELYDRQMKFDRELSQTKTAGTSLTETIKRLGMSGRQDLAFRLRDDMKMNDKSFWWAFASGLAADNRWRDLQDFVASSKKRLPYGMLGVIQICAQYQHFTGPDIKEYVTKLEAAERVKGLILIGYVHIYEPHIFIF